MILGTKFSPGKLSRAGSAGKLRQGVVFMADPQEKVLEDIKLQPAYEEGKSMIHCFSGNMKKVP